MSQLFGPEVLGQILSDLLEKGFEPPLHAVNVGVNGAMLYSKFEWADDGEGLDTTFLAEHYPDGETVGFMTPIMCMIVDRTGQAAKIEIGKDGGVD